ncbi:MAG: hypothetical protein AB1894_26960 [Chloroflexota bacterium]
MPCWYVYFGHSASVNYIIICIAGVVVPVNFEHVLIPWDKVERLGPVQIDGKNFNLGLILREPIESIVKMKKIMKRLFPLVYVDEQVIALSPFVDRKQELVNRVKIALEQL